MKNQLFAASMLAPPATVVNGQKDFLQAGTFTFTVPAGVYSLNVALVASGKDGASAKSGDGGNLRYQNNIPVKPGQEFSVTVGKPASTFTSFGTLNSSTALSSTVLGGNGSTGRTVVKGAANRVSQGGNVGGQPGVNGTGIDLTTWTFIPANGGEGSASSAKAPGGGGGAYWGANDIYPSGYGGWTGAVRIIWGPDRAFPNKKIGNL